MREMRNKRTSPRRWLVLLFGDIDFDGRARRMIDIASCFGTVYLLDCSERSNSGSDVRYVHERLVVAPEHSQPRRHLSFLRHALAFARRVRPHVVLAEDFFTAMPGRMAAAACSAQFIYDAHELIIPSAEEITSRRSRFWANLERRAAPGADLVIAANAERAAIMTENYPLRRAATYMRNIPTAAAPTQDALNAVTAKHPVLVRSEPGTVLILYQGAIVAARGLTRFIEATAYLPSSHRLIMAGDGPDLHSLKGMAGKERFSGRITFLGRVLNSELAAVAKLCDVGIATYAYDTRNSLLCAPNKVFEYAQAGLAVLASDQVTLLNLLRERPWARLIGPEVGAKAVAEHLVALGLDRRNHAADIERFLTQNSPSAEQARVSQAIWEVLH